MANGISVLAMPFSKSAGRLTSRVMTEADPHAFRTPNRDKTSAIRGRCQKMSVNAQQASITRRTEWHRASDFACEGILVTIGGTAATGDHGRDKERVRTERLDLEDLV